MTRACSILLVDSNPDDLALTALVLRRELPQATVVTVPDAMALAEAMSSAPDVAVIAAGELWAAHDAIVGAIRRRSPATAVVVFGHDADILARTLTPGLVCDGVVRKTSAGYLRLPAIVGDVLERRTPPPSHAAAPAAPADARRVQPEMRDMAMAFSHDLREPLQQIERLIELGQTNREVAGQTLVRVLECATRASSMLDGMLEYLAVAGRDGAPATVDLNTSLQESLENLHGAIEASHADISAAPLPKTLGDAYQLRHLFQNLISNALKFHGRERPRIRIDVGRQGSQWLLRFRDNGIGIAQPFAERVFEMGQRLHTRDEYPGLGIGLALCRRIAERHGGKIWVEPNETGGSTFCVTLPEADTAEWTIGNTRRTASTPLTASGDT